MLDVLINPVPEVVNAPAKFMLVTSSVLPETIFNKDEIVKILPLLEGVMVIYVDGLGIEIELMDCAGIFVTEAEAMKIKVSEVEGVTLFGYQLEETVKFVEVLPVQKNIFLEFAGTVGISISEIGVGTLSGVLII